MNEKKNEKKNDEKRSIKRKLFYSIILPYTKVRFTLFKNRSW